MKITKYIIRNSISTGLYLTVLLTAFTAFLPSALISMNQDQRHHHKTRQKSYKISNSKRKINMIIRQKNNFIILPFMSDYYNII